MPCKAPAHFIFLLFFSFIFCRIHAFGIRGFSRSSRNGVSKCSALRGCLLRFEKQEESYEEALNRALRQGSIRDVEGRGGPSVERGVRNGESICLLFTTNWDEKSSRLRAALASTWEDECDEAREQIWATWRNTMANTRTRSLDELRNMTKSIPPPPSDTLPPCYFLEMRLLSRSSITRSGRHSPALIEKRQANGTSYFNDEHICRLLFDLSVDISRGKQKRLPYLALYPPPSFNTTTGEMQWLTSHFIRRPSLLISATSADNIPTEPSSSSSSSVAALLPYIEWGMRAKEDEEQRIAEQAKWDMSRVQKQKPRVKLKPIRKKFPKILRIESGDFFEELGEGPKNIPGL